MADQQPAYEPASGCIVRLYWVFAGNALLALALTQIVFGELPFFTWTDAFYWANVVLILAARYADIRSFRGTTTTGQPATFADWRRHALVLVGIAGAAWFAAHLTAYLTRDSA